MQMIISINHVSGYYVCIYGKQHRFSTNLIIIVTATYFGALQFLSIYTSGTILIISIQGLNLHLILPRGLTLFFFTTVSQNVLTMITILILSTKRIKIVKTFLLIKTTLCYVCKIEYNRTLFIMVIINEQKPEKGTFTYTLFSSFLINIISCY